MTPCSEYSTKRLAVNSCCRGMCRYVNGDSVRYVASCCCWAPAEERSLLRLSSKMYTPNNTAINLPAALQIDQIFFSNQLTCPLVCVHNKASSPCIQPLSPPSQVWSCAPARSPSSMRGDGPYSGDNTWRTHTKHFKEDLVQINGDWGSVTVLVFVSVHVSGLCEFGSSLPLPGHLQDVLE